MRNGKTGSHFEEFDTIINSGSPAGESDFLIQEINREVIQSVQRQVILKSQNRCNAKG
ncbi:MAG: hypothetical protein ACLTLI_00255 [Clostridia bacterium]